MIKRTYENILINEIDNIDYIVVEIIDDEFIDDDEFDIENEIKNIVENNYDHKYYNYEINDDIITVFIYR